jgi:hypothetical protein
MNAGKAVYGILSANSGVTDIVGTNIFPEIAEQETAVPFIVYQLQSVDPDDTHDGPSKLDEVRFEFLCYADSYNAAADLGVAVRAALDRVSGTYNGVHVESVQFNDVDVNIEYDPRRYSQVLTFTFRIKRDDVTIALGTPVTGAVLGDLSDVDVDGVTNGQLIAYNSTSGNWEAANDAGGAEELDDLSDVKIVGTPSEGDALVFQSGFFQLGQAGASTLGDLDDVNTVGAAAGSLISYNGVDGWEISAGELPSDQVYYHNRYSSEAETLLDGATETVELYYTAQADGDGLHEDAQTDTAQSGYDIRRKLYYAEKAQADPDTSADWTQFTAIADNTTFNNAKAALLAYLKERTGGTVPISLKMTWEEVAEATLLLDTYTGAAAAYSLRKLRTLYTGDAVEVYNGSSYADIGFDGSGELDTVALAAHCGSNDGFVSKWYDQSGNTNDAAQATTANMPKIYDGATTSVVTENGKPALDLDGAGDELNATAYDEPTLTSIVVTVNDTTNANNRASIIAGASGSSKATMAHANDLSLRYDGAFSAGTQTAATNTQYLRFAVRTTSSQTEHVNGASNASTSLTLPNASGTINIGSAANTFLHFDGRVQEAVLYSSDQSSNRTGIETNINTFYNIYS